MTINTARLRALAEAATPGPWEADGNEVSQHWSRPEPWKTVASSEVACMSYCYGGSGRGIEDEADAAYIAAADPSTMLALLDEIESLRDQVDSMQMANDMLRATHRTDNQYLLDEIERYRDALEAAERERDNWKLSAEEAERAEKRWERRVRIAEQERDQYAAVVEKAEDFVTRHYLDTTFGDEVLPILAAPADALREHDARVWDEGFEAGWAEKGDLGAFVNDVWDAKTPNPYREGQEDAS